MEFYRLYKCLSTGKIHNGKTCKPKRSLKCEKSWENIYLEKQNNISWTW